MISDDSILVKLYISILSLRELKLKVKGLGTLTKENKINLKIVIEEYHEFLQRKYVKITFYLT